MKWMNANVSLAKRNKKRKLIGVKKKINDSREKRIEEKKTEGKT